jgi:outer membrane protein OmpA-like peptidoglycan-associated protein
MPCRFVLAVLAVGALMACETPVPAAGQQPEPPMQPRADEPPGYVIFFDIGKATISARGMATIREAAGSASRPGVTSVEVTGHTDRAGSEHANEALSLRRAWAVRDLLVRQGVPGAVISVRGLGESKPFMATEDTTHAPENRRVEIVIR